MPDQTRHGIERVLPDGGEGIGEMKRFGSADIVLVFGEPFSDTACGQEEEVVLARGGDGFDFAPFVCDGFRPFFRKLQEKRKKFERVDIAFVFGYGQGIEDGICVRVLAERGQRKRLAFRCPAPEGRLVVGRDVAVILCRGGIVSFEFGRERRAGERSEIAGIQFFEFGNQFL